MFRVGAVGILTSFLLASGSLAWTPFEGPETRDDPNFRRDIARMFEVYSSSGAGKTEGRLFILCRSIEGNKFAFEAQITNLEGFEELVQESFKNQEKLIFRGNEFAPPLIYFATILTNQNNTRIVYRGDYFEDSNWEGVFSNVKLRDGSDPQQYFFRSLFTFYPGSFEEQFWLESTQISLELVPMMSEREITDFGERTNETLVVEEGTNLWVNGIGIDFDMGDTAQALKMASKECVERVEKFSISN